MMLHHIGLKYALSLIKKDRPLNILDIGAGYGFWGYLLKAHLEYEPKLTGIEIYPPHVKRLKRLGIYDEIIMGDATEIKLPWFDVAILSHVIEHIPQVRAEHLIEYLQSRCKQIIVLCPEGDARFHDDQVGASHLSQWRIKEFEALGFKAKHIHFSAHAGRVVSMFERLYFALKGVRRPGVIVASWSID